LVFDANAPTDLHDRCASHLHIITTPAMAHHHFNNHSNFQTYAPPHMLDTPSNSDTDQQTQPQQEQQLASSSESAESANHSCSTFDNTNERAFDFIVFDWHGTLEEDQGEQRRRVGYLFGSPEREAAFRTSYKAAKRLHRVNTLSVQPLDYSKPAIIRKAFDTYGGAHSQERKCKQS
jgi:hypothetical protein